MTQERLNNCIAEELNKWQPILEYGRIYLDEDKALRDKYRWLIWIKTCWPWSFGLTIIEGIISLFCGQNLLYILLGVFVIVTIAVSLIIYKNRNVISKFASESDKSELNRLLENTNSYISKLSRWLAELDNHIKVSSTTVKSIEKEYIEARANQLPNDNKFSRIHGNLNEDWVERAKNLADKRLQPLKQYIYE
jgi:hypothetical protein